MSDEEDMIVRRFGAELRELYGDRLERAVLYGSRARGDARPDSDYDVAVFLNDFNGFGAELSPIVDIETRILLDTGAVINAFPLKAGSYSERTGFMHEVRKDGRDI